MAAVAAVTSESRHWCSLHFAVDGHPCEVALRLAGDDATPLREAVARAQGVGSVDEIGAGATPISL